MLSHQYERVDAELVSGRLRWTRDLAIDYAQGVQFHPLAEKMSEVKAISMLGLETLMMCRAFALTSKLGVIELGPYIGGSTVALAMGLRETSTQSMISVDTGGVNDNPRLPSADIHGDWRKNIQRFGVGNIPVLVGGDTNEPGVMERVTAAAGGRRFDLFFVDADGDVARSLRDFDHLLADDCLLILDDYFNVHGVDTKQDSVMRQVNQMLLDGKIEQYVLAPWSTWFGRLTR